MYQVELCDTFIRISKGVWRWMRRARRVTNPSLAKRASPWGMQLRETTLTDYVVLRLLEECAPVVSVFTFPPFMEAKTAADMEIWITDETGLWLGLRVQCKILGPDGKFRELHYQRNGQYQCDLLIQSAERTPGCFPIYLLFVGPYGYNLPPKGCPYDPWLYGPYWESMWGNWWLSAYRVRQIRLQNDLVTLYKFMVPWHCTFCYPWPQTPTSAPTIYAYLYLVHTVFKEDRGIIDIRPSETAPPYVVLAREGALPDAVEELQRLLEGKEMHYLVILDFRGSEG